MNGLPATEQVGKREVTDDLAHVRKKCKFFLLSCLIPDAGRTAPTVCRVQYTTSK